MKSQLYRPDMTRHHREHRQRHQPIILGEMARRPHRKGAFGQVPQQYHQETYRAQYAADVPGPDTAAAQFPNVQAGTHAHQVISGSKTTQTVSPQSHTTPQPPVGGLKLFNPRHIYVRSCSKRTSAPAIDFFDAQTIQSNRFLPDLTTHPAPPPALILPKMRIPAECSSELDLQDRCRMML